MNKYYESDIQINKCWAEYEKKFSELCLNSPQEARLHLLGVRPISGANWLSDNDIITEDTINDNELCLPGSMSLQNFRKLFC